jgi:RND family efflux transporter MFP subunit
MRAPFALALLLAACTKGAANTPTPTPSARDAVPVRVATVDRGPVIRTLDLGGVAAATRAARLAPASQGKIASIRVALGDSVQAGQLLAELDNEPLRLQAEAARKSLQLARLQVGDADREAARVEGLAGSGAVTQQALDKAAFGRQLAHAQFDQAEAQAAALESQLRLARVEAPFSGVVTSVGGEVGELWTGVGGLTGPPSLVEIQALDRIQLDIDIPETDVARVRPGMNAVVTSDLDPNLHATGTVQVVNAAATPGARTWLVRLDIPNPEGVLKPGMFLRAAIEVERVEDAVRAPRKAVVKSGDEHFVISVGDGLAKRVPVTPSTEGGGLLALTGIDPGALVVLDGQLAVPDGTAVRVIE